MKNEPRFRDLNEGGEDQSTLKGVIIPKKDLDTKLISYREWLLPIAFSLLGHLLIILLFLFGLPSFGKKLPEEKVIAFEMLPVADISNIKTQKVQKEKETEVEEAKKVQQSKPKEIKEEVKPEPIKPEPIKPEIIKPEPKEEVVKPEPKEEEVKPEPKEEVKPEPKKAEPIPEKAKELPKKAEKPKEIIKPKEVKKEPPKKKKAAETDLDSLLKTLEKSSEGKEEKSKKKSVSEQSDAKHEAKGEFNDKLALSVSEAQYIAGQIERHWNIPAGAQDAGEVVITLYLALKPDGTVDSVKLIDQKCPIGNTILCQASADSAIRAVWSASPFQGLAVERYNSWKAFNINLKPDM